MIFVKGPNSSGAMLAEDLAGRWVTTCPGDNASDWVLEAFKKFCRIHRLDGEFIQIRLAPNYTIFAREGYDMARILVDNGAIKEYVYLS